MDAVVRRQGIVMITRFQSGLAILWTSGFGCSACASSVCGDGYDEAIAGTYDVSLVCPEFPAPRNVAVCVSNVTDSESTPWGADTRAGFRADLLVIAGQQFVRNVSFGGSCDSGSGIGSMIFDFVGGAQDGTLSCVVQVDAPRGQASVPNSPCPERNRLGRSPCALTVSHERGSCP